MAEATPGVMACQLIQRAEAELIVRLSVTDGDDEQEVWSTLRERLAAFLSTQEVEGVTIEKDDEPPALHPRSGKFRQVYSELAAPQGR